MRPVREMALKVLCPASWQTPVEQPRPEKTIESCLSCLCVKLTKSNKTTETYAFMDNGSQSTFCSEKLMRQLNVEGKKTQILLCTMGQEKLEPSYYITGLEVCGLKENVYVDLPGIYTHKDIPVSKENIPLPRRGWGVRLRLSITLHNTMAVPVRRKVTIRYNFDHEGTTGLKYMSVIKS